LSSLASNYNTSAELSDARTQIVPFFIYLTSEQRKFVNDAFAIQRQKLNQGYEEQNNVV
jgi:hypothetical protein